MVLVDRAGKGMPGMHVLRGAALWAVTGTGRVARTSCGRGSSCAGAGGLGARCVPGAQVGMVGMRAGTGGHLRVSCYLVQLSASRQLF